MSLKIGLSIDHIGRGGRRTGDQGAAVDVDGDGHADFIEARLTWRIVESAWTTAHDRGHQVFIFADGEYSDRHDRANALKLDCYIANHVNTGRGDYGAFFHDPDTTAAGGVALARHCAATWSRAARPPLGRPLECKAISARGYDWRNPRYTIKGLQNGVVGICAEWFFLDNAQHRQGLANTRALMAAGVALIDGIEAWGSSRAIA